MSVGFHPDLQSRDISKAAQFFSMHDGLRDLWHLAFESEAFEIRVAWRNTLLPHWSFFTKVGWGWLEAVVSLSMPLAHFAHP